MWGGGKKNSEVLLLAYGSKVAFADLLLSFEEFMKASLIHDSSEGISPLEEDFLVCSEEFAWASMLVKFKSSRFA